jgi:hypothetical protein
LLVKYNADNVGVTRTTGTMMFGEKHNSSFRAVLKRARKLMMDFMTQ